MHTLERIFARPQETLCLGQAGEHFAREVVFDLSDWVSRYGTGMAVLNVLRQGEHLPYPAVLERDGTLAIWSLQSSDTAHPGWGRCELAYIVGEQIVKSQQWVTYVEPSLGGSSPAPEPQQGWVEQVLQAGASALDAAARAETAAGIAGPDSYAPIRCGTTPPASMKDGDLFIRIASAE